MPGLFSTCAVIYQFKYRQQFSYLFSEMQEACLVCEEQSQSY